MWKTVFHSLWVDSAFVHMSLLMSSFRGGFINSCFCDWDNKKGQADAGITS